MKNRFCSRLGFLLLSEISTPLCHDLSTRQISALGITQQNPPLRHPIFTKRPPGKHVGAGAWFVSTARGRCDEALSSWSKHDYFTTTPNPRTLAKRTGPQNSESMPHANGILGIKPNWNVCLGRYYRQYKILIFDRDHGSTSVQGNGMHCSRSWRTIWSKQWGVTARGARASPLRDPGFPTRHVDRSKTTSPLPNAPLRQCPAHVQLLALDTNFSTGQHGQHSNSNCETTSPHNGGTQRHGRGCGQWPYNRTCF